MEVDRLLRDLGKFGKWQILINPKFPGYQPAHRCKIPTNSSLDDWIPHDDSSSNSHGMNATQWSKCEMYVNASVNNETSECLDGWEYEDEEIGDGLLTIVSQWDLVCTRDFLVQTSQVVLVLGIMCGSIAITIISDRFGRKPVFITCQMLLVLFGSLSALMPNIHWFIVSKFFIGLVEHGVTMIGFVLMYELFTVDERTFLGLIGGNFWGFACALMPIFAYFIKNWTYFQLFISLIPLTFIPLFWHVCTLFPESVHWLYANDRMDEVNEVLKSAARMNKVAAPLVNVSNKVTTKEMKDQKFLREEKLFVPSSVEHRAVRYTMADLFRNATMLKHLSICVVAWTSCTLVYYGLTWSTAQLSGTRYWNAFFNGLVEMPAYTLSYFIVIRFGRRNPMATFFLIDGSKASMWVTALNLIGKFGITGAFGISFIYVGELFPTNLRIFQMLKCCRSQAMGLCCLFGRIGLLAATFSTYIATTHPILTSFTFAILSILAAILLLLLPETIERPLPETIEEIEDWKYNNPQHKILGSFEKI
ncbi:hypothetical protein HELRODRAFT_181398 [Helobdella robusta]|uniref:Major facilitator superfamily (MFS) profile domain-containing protein n=1 Tax=Helobdella robusta TaxID=6412 RepID=T1FGY8_HELRO|nr:hypothetical protein HELRODRAFT_181398 [Helobdella robusta]ESN92522.1 hypothetical protein HELRODRAFT_181398 [Helobdella robusta]